MNANDFIQFLNLFKREAKAMKPLRFWAVYFALTASAFLYLVPPFIKALH